MLLALGLAVTSVLGSFVDYEKREINIKIVYVATTDDVALEHLEYIHAKTNPDAKSKLVKFDNAGGPAVYGFNFVPLSLGEIRGFKCRFHLYTSTTGKGFAEARKVVMKGADAVVFIADRDPKRATANTAALANVKADVAGQGYAWSSMVTVYEAVGAGDLAVVRKSLGLPPETVIFEADPVAGPGVFDALKATAKGTLMALRDGARDGGK